MFKPIICLVIFISPSPEQKQKIAERIARFPFGAEGFVALEPAVSYIVLSPIEVLERELRIDLRVDHNVQYVLLPLRDDLLHLDDSLSSAVHALVTRCYEEQFLWARDYAKNQKECGY